MITKLFKKAAIRFRLTPRGRVSVIEASSHTLCYEKIKSEYEVDVLSSPEEFQVEEGYILHNGAFVDRFDAMKIVSNAGLVIEEYKDDLLFFDYKVDWSKVNET